MKFASLIVIAVCIFSVSAGYGGHKRRMESSYGGSTELSYGAPQEMSYGMKEEIKQSILCHCAMSCVRRRTNKGGKPYGVELAKTWTPQNQSSSPANYVNEFIHRFRGARR